MQLRLFLLFVYCLPLVATCTGPCVHDSGLTSGTGTVAVTITAPTVGNILIGFFGSGSSGVSLPSITQTNVVWSKLAQSSTQRDNEIWIGAISASPGTSVSFNIGGGAASFAEVVEFTGYQGTQDGGSGGTQSGTTGTPISGTITTANASDLLLAGTRQNGAGSSSLTGGFTSLVSGVVSLSTGYRVVSSTATYSATWTNSGATNWDAAIVAVKLAYQQKSHLIGFTH